MSNNFKFEIKEIADLKEVIKCVKESGKKIVILSGTLGSGKTTFVKEFVKSLGIEEEVNSPTFSIQNSYGGKVFHYDLYNKDADTFLSLALFEELENDGYHFIEWGEGLEDYLKKFGLDYLKIVISLENDNLRIFNCID
jgi:tRNA threonylcarbamoyladenosine biosynthesis protein TsaE